MQSENKRTKTNGFRKEIMNNLINKCRNFKLRENNKLHFQNFNRSPCRY